MSKHERPPELARCEEHGLVLMETADSAYHTECVACEFGIPFLPERSPENDTLTNSDFRGRLEWGAVTELIPLVREYLEDRQDSVELWVTHVPWSGDLPAGYAEQERFIPVIGYEWGAMEKFILRNGAAEGTVETLRENGYRGGN